MVKLLNSAVMPSPDFAYRPRRIDRDEFISILKEAHQKGMLESYIGYPSTADHIARISGVDVGINRAQTSVCGGDVMLICKLKYRLDNPGLKSDRAFQESLGDEDYEYWLIEVLEQEELASSQKRGMMR